jgi:hypothetical protein
MNIGDLVRIKDHPEQTGLVLNIYDEDGFEWIKIQWFGYEQECLTVPLRALNHLEVIA